MTFARKLLFALLHPLVTVRFVKRIILNKLQRRQPYNHTVTPRSGTISSADCVLPAFEKIPQELLIKEADEILKGKRCIYGHAHFSVKKTDWQCDYLSNYTWDGSTFNQDILYNYAEGIDIKNPWELSRLHHVVHVGRAYRESKNEAYAEFISAEITDWIVKNPVYYGVNWKVAMEAGIRSMNLLMSYSFIQKSTVASSLRPLLLGSLQEHADYIMQNLEIYGVRSNHYFSDLVGLAWIGILCPDLPRASRYKKYALKELAKETIHQFRPDGLGFESSLAYHRLVLELLGFTAVLFKEYALEWPQVAWDRMERAFEATAGVIAPDGTIPHIGDNDSGRGFVTGSYFSWEALNITHLFPLGSLLFPSNQVLTGKSPAPHTFPESGIRILANNTWWLAAACVPVGQDENGGHNHDDAGTFSLWYKGQPIIIDPGTGHYTSYPKIRNAFRSYAAHNAPRTKGKSPEPDKLLFTHGAKAHGEFSETAPLTMAIHAPEFSGTRTVELDQKIIVTDTVSEGPLQLVLTLSPGITPKKKSGTVEIGPVTLVTTAESTLTTVPYSAAYAHVGETHAIILESPTKSLIFEIL
jgi:hypothetical protein